MNNRNGNDEKLLIDFLHGSCEEKLTGEVEDRLAEDESFKQLHDDLKNSLQALELLPESSAPEDLVAKTLARVESARQTQALLAKEELARPAVRPTFSARELSVAAAAVLVMGIILVPSMRMARNRARINECYSQVGQIGTGFLTYANTYDGYLPAITGRSQRWLRDAKRPAVSNSAALFKLIRGGFVNSPVLFQCPGVGGSSFEVRAGMTDFPEGRYIGYSYHHSVGVYRLRIGDPTLDRVGESMAILADTTPIFRGGRFRPSYLTARAGPNHAGEGQNVLYLDMHVQWASTPNVGVNSDHIYLARGISRYEGDEAPAEPSDSFLLPSYSPKE